jgi:hypothetical protein
LIALNYSSDNEETKKKDENFHKTLEIQQQKVSKSKQQKTKENENVEVYYMVLDSFNDIRFSISKNITKVDKERFLSYERTITSIFTSLIERVSNDEHAGISIAKEFLKDAKNLDNQMKYGVNSVLLKSVGDITIEYAKVMISKFKSKDVNL